MKKYLFLLWSLVLGASAAFAQAPEVRDTVTGYEGPYVLWQDDMGVRIVYMTDGVVSDSKTFPKFPAGFGVQVSSNGGGYRFEVPFHGPIEHKAVQELAPTCKMLVMSDLHGRMDAFAALLLNNGVVDDRLSWSYGSNKLVFIGDVLDRGRDDTAIMWLLYKLESEAAAAGGEVVFLPGNHEDLVLKNDLRYVNKAHLGFAETIGIPYDELWGAESELGRWVRERNMIVRIGDNLFVHAGLSSDMVREGYGMGEMNARSREYLGIPNKTRNEMDGRNTALFGNSGPIWYRGMAYDDEKYNPITDEQLDEVLRCYGGKRVFIGHSEVDEIESRYGGRVIAVNVAHYENFPGKRTGALLIDGGRLYAVDYEGNRTILD